MGVGPSLFIGTPTLDGKVCVEYMRGYAETALLFSQLGGVASEEVRSSNLPRGRDILFDRFRKSGADYWLSVDADIRWGASDVVALMQREKDFVSGTYCVKNGTGDICVRLAPGETWSNDRMMSAAGLPGGFFLMTRALADRVAEHWKHRTYRMPDGARYLSLHDHILYEDREQYDGEDYAFTTRVLEAGGEAWLDPLVRVGHVGQQIFTTSASPKVTE